MSTDLRQKLIDALWDERLEDTREQADRALAVATYRRPPSEGKESE